MIGHYHSFIYEFPVGIPAVILGFVILTLGRKLFWLFVGTVGFVSGLHIAAYAVQGHSDWVILVTGLLAGIIGVFVAIFLQKAAVIAGGFLAGGYLVLSFINLWGWHSGPGIWFISLAGGIIGAIVAATYFDWALIILSSLTGAIMISQSLTFSPLIRGAAFSILIFIGIFAQSRLRDKNISQVTQSKNQ